MKTQSKFLFTVLLCLTLQTNSFSQNLNDKKMTESKTIVFIHGLFVNPESWAEWKTYFEAKGYKCYTPANPSHEGNPTDLRKQINPNLAKVNFEDVVNNIVKLIDSLPEKPIVIGHSLAGLVVQKLVSMDKVAVGVCIDGAAPQGIVTTKWSFWKVNGGVVNPFKGNSVFEPNKKWFHYSFCNTMTREESDKVFDKYVVPESRNIPRGTLKSFAKINFKSCIIWRFDILANLLLTVTKIMFAYILWKAVFGENDVIGGFTFYSMFTYYVTGAFLSGADMSKKISTEIESVA